MLSKGQGRKQGEASPLYGLFPALSVEVSELMVPGGGGEERAALLAWCFDYKQLF